MRPATMYLVILSLAAMSHLAVAQNSEVYKWVDADGVTHYDVRPPDWSVAEETGVRIRHTDKQVLEARLKHKAEKAEAAETRQRHRADEVSEAEQDRQKIASQRATNCEQARGRMAAYNTARRLYRPMPDGERDYLSDDELDAERIAARQSVDEWCTDS